jgi:spoIIIJ-associated protein
VARDVLAELLERMGFAAEVHIHQAEPAPDEEEGPLVLDVRGPGVDALIGRRGETLAALQRIIRLIVGRRMAERVNLVVDVDGFKQRRERNLRRLAARMAERAVQSGRTVALEPMSAYERRIVHLALRDRTDVRTESVGTGYRRRVTIIPQPAEEG